MHRDKVREALVSAVVSSCILAAFLPPPRPTSEAVIQAIVGSKQAANFTAEDLIPQRYHELRSSSSAINIGIILKNLDSKRGLQIKKQFLDLTRSILKQTSSRVHFVFLTDRASALTINRLMLKFLPRIFPSSAFTFELFDLSAIVARFIPEIASLRPHFTATNLEARKYADDLFMIGPFLHRVLPYRRLIMLDADLLFRVDIARLHSLFDDFSGAEVMGVGPDLAPHYYHVLRFYREANPGTDIGSPGRFQGFNTGVVLYDLDRMRGSAVYKAYTTNEGGCVDKLAEKYVYKSHLGDQCFFTLLGLEHPELFHALPCGYNFQLDQNMWHRPFLEVFPAYHNCTEVPKVYHMNGGHVAPDAEKMKWYEVDRFAK